VLAEQQDDDDGPAAPRTLLVCGHAIYLPAMALRCADALGIAAPEARRVLLESVTGEAAAYLLTPWDDAEPVRLLEA